MEPRYLVFGVLGEYKGDCIGVYYGVMKEDTRSLD